MNHYGNRYLRATQFTSHCRSLNVSVDLRELEHYEKEGLMLPVARVLYPDDYVTLKHKLTHGVITPEFRSESVARNN